MSHHQRTVDFPDTLGVCIATVSQIIEMSKRNCKVLDT